MSSLTHPQVVLNLWVSSKTRTLGPAN